LSRLGDWLEEEEERMKEEEKKEDDLVSKIIFLNKFFTFFRCA